MVKIGIYKILNKITGDCYVGSSNNLARRFLTHKRLLKKGNHHSIVLQRAWIKYGPSSFKFVILESVKEEKLEEREQYYINTLPTVYNILKIAYSTRGRKMPKEEIKQRIESAYKKKTVYQFDLSGTCGKEWESVRAAAREIECRPSQIFGVISGDRRTCKGYIWAYTKDKKLTKPKTGKNTYYKEVAISKKTKKELVFNSIAEANKNIGR